MALLDKWCSSVTEEKRGQRRGALGGSPLREEGGRVITREREREWKRRLKKRGGGRTF